MFHDIFALKYCLFLIIHSADVFAKDVANTCLHTKNIYTIFVRSHHLFRTSNGSRSNRSRSVLVVRLLPKVEWLLHLWFSSAKWGWSSDNGSKLQIRVSKAWEGTGHLRVVSLMGYLIVMLRDSVILITESWRICFFQYGTRIDDIQTLSTIDFKHYFIKCFFSLPGDDDCTSL